MSYQRPRSPALGAKVSFGANPKMHKCSGTIPEIKQFLEKYANNTSISEREKLDKMIQHAVKQYMEEHVEEQHRPASHSLSGRRTPRTPQGHYGQQGHQQRLASPAIRQSIVPRKLGPKCTELNCEGPADPPLLIDGKPPVEPKENNSQWATWRSYTPATGHEYDLELFRHYQNPHKPMPFKDPVNKGSRHRGSVCDMRPKTAQGFSGETKTNGFAVDYASNGYTTQVPNADPLCVHQRPSSSRPASRNAGTYRRPASAGPGFRTMRDAGIPGSTNFNTIVDPNTGQAYVPELKAWIDGADQSERAVAYNVMKILQKGKQLGMEGVTPRYDPMLYQGKAFATTHVPMLDRKTMRPRTPVENYMGLSQSNYPSDDVRRMVAHEDKSKLCASGAPPYRGMPTSQHQPNVYRPHSAMPQY